MKSFSEYFQEAHELGAKEFGPLWLGVNLDLSRNMQNQFNITDPTIKAVIAVAVLRAMRMYRESLAQSDAPTDGGETAPFTLNAEEREVVEQAIDAYMSSHTRLVQDGVIVTLDKRLVAAKNDETTSPEVEPDKDYADRIHRPVK